MKKLLTLMVALLAAGTASAHTGHGTHSMMEGLLHPLGWDHLLAMVAVGAWSVAALPAGQRWQGPLAFVGSMVLAAMLGASGVAVTLTEQAIALSVALLGAMLVFGRQLPRQVGLAAVAAAALFHGLAHGAELPVAGVFAGYVAGFVLTTVALHVAGLGLGHVLNRAGQWAWRLLGAGLGVVGMGLLTSV